MTTQLKPLTSGSFTTVSKTSDGKAKKDTVGLPAPPGMAHAALRAINMWANCGGAGNPATSAQKTAHAAGVQLQEV